jgi:hypothetical protein
MSPVRAKSVSTKRRYKSGGHKPTPETRTQVETMSGMGIRQIDIAVILSITHGQLVKRYRQQLDLGKAKANLSVGKTLYQKAVSGDTACMIFWAKTQMGWTEKIEVTGPEGGPIQVADTTVLQAASEELRLYEAAKGITPVEEDDGDEDDDDYYDDDAVEEADFEPIADEAEARPNTVSEDDGTSEAMSG